MTRRRVWERAAGALGCERALALRLDDGGLVAAGRWVVVVGAGRSVRWLTTCYGEPEIRKRPREG